MRAGSTPEYVMMFRTVPAALVLTAREAIGREGRRMQPPERPDSSTPSEGSARKGPPGRRPAAQRAKAGQTRDPAGEPTPQPAPPEAPDAAATPDTPDA